MKDLEPAALISPDEARALLSRMLSGRTLSGDYVLFDSLFTGPRTATMPSDVWEMVGEWLVQQVGPDIMREVQAELNTAKIVPPSREQLAKDKAAGITTQFHIACGQFKKKNGEPKKTLVARHMFDLGFMLADIADVSGYSRGSLSDARQFCRSKFIRAGKPLPPNLQVDPKYHARRTGGDDRRGGRGQLFEENREASRLVASVADVLAPVPPKKKKRKAYSNATEGIASAPINGTWDMGADYEDEGETE